MIIGAAIAMALSRIIQKFKRKKQPEKKVDFKKDTFALQHDCSDCSAEGIINVSVEEGESRDLMGKHLFDYQEKVEEKKAYWIGHYKPNIPFNKIYSERLAISFMLKYFIMQVFGLDDYNLWLDRWEKLCETPKPKVFGKES